jgi:hypothetical protein
LTHLTRWVATPTNFFFLVVAGLDWDQLLLKAQEPGTAGLVKKELHIEAGLAVPEEVKKTKKGKTVDPYGPQQPAWALGSVAPEKWEAFDKFARVLRQVLFLFLHVAFITVSLCLIKHLSLKGRI